MKSILTFGIVSIILLSGCIQQGPGLEFSAGPCDESIDAYTEDLGVKEVTWIDDTTLVVTVLVGINCAEEIEGGDFRIVGNTIILQFTSPQCETCTFCVCAHELTYKFTNLEKKEYQFELERIL
ncbi:MAG: hypothetical protein HXS48_01805 [Theionarchaea archaeon]|nr:MAG: hypothetical protein AYK19_19995 [Theionarchaea archaeon DG-70-1]MBU7025648.1 hypothetical protein [Theionarchaea archaeon]